MKLNKVIAALAVIAMSQQSFAADLTQNAQAQGADQVSQEDLATALAVLLEAGVIQIEKGEVKVKNRSALEQLNDEGRVKVQAAAMHSICL